MRTSLVILFVLASMLMRSSASLWATSALGETDGAAAEQMPASPAPVVPMDGRLASSLYALYDYADDAALTRAQARSHGLVMDAQGRIRVVVHVAESAKQAAVTTLAAHGFEAEVRQGEMIQGLVPPSRLKDLATAPGVRLVRPPLEPVAAVESEGVAVIGADLWQASGLTGSGVSLAVVDLGFQDYDDLLGTDLPGAVSTHSARADGDLEAGQSHGVACAEVVYDVAPGAAMHLVNFSTDVEFAQAVQYVRDNDIDIVSCSVGWPVGGPGDGTGRLANTVVEAYYEGTLWVNSAGNQAVRHWMDTWTDVDSDTFHEYAPLDETNTIQVQAGEQARVAMRWEDTWGAAVSSFSLELYDADLNLVAATSTSATGPGDPTRYLSVEGLAPGQYRIAIRRLDSNASAPRMELFTYDQNLFEYADEESSLTVPADVAEVVSVGAVGWDVPNTLEDFSSQGPTIDGRLKPDLVGPDRVSSVTKGGYIPFTNAGFWGTSAAAPHVAGAAALLWEDALGASQADIAALLRTLTVDLGVSGPDNAFGYGRLSIGDALAETPTPSYTPTRTRTPTMTRTATATASATATRTGTVTTVPTETPTRTPDGPTLPARAAVPLVLKGHVQLTPTPTPTPSPTLDDYPGPATATATLTPPPGTIPADLTPTATATGATPTRTVTQTRTRTATPTRTRTRTLTPTPTQLPGNCRDLIGNGGFETYTSWQRGVTPHMAAYTDIAFHSGLFSMRFGIEPDAENVMAFSSAYQNVTIPWNATSATLRLWWQRLTEEEPLTDDAALASRSLLGRYIGDVTYTQDLQEVLILDTGGKVLAMPARTRSDDGQWVELTFDLLPWRGRTIQLYINAFNDGEGGRTWMYVDDVSIEVCTP